MAQAARKTNWFAIWVTAGVVVALALVAVLVVTLNNAATAPGEKPTASNITDEGAIVFGSSSENTIETYVDFLCPYCNQFEQTEGESIKHLVEDGTATLQVTPVTILDQRSSPAGFSSRASSAMYSVAIHDPDNSYAFMQALYANQPEEGSAGLSDSEIIQVAKDAGVDVTDELEDEITSHKYQKFAQALELPEGSTGTPTLIVNGSLVPVTFDFEKDIAANLN